MATSLTSDLRQGYREVAPRLSGEQRQLIERARSRGGKCRKERDRALADIVYEYRAGPRELWAPVILDLVAPAMLARLQHLVARPPYVEDEDLSQQLVVQLLHAAATMRVPCDGRHLRYEIVARACKAVSRRLAREHRHLAWHCLLDVADGVDE